jgi:small-conductance mechanosensitive channel
MEDILKQQVLGRPMVDFFVAVGIILGSIIIVELIRRLALRSLRKRGGESTGGGRYASRVIRTFVIPGLYIAALYGAVRVLRPAERVSAILEPMFVVLLTLLVVRLLMATASFAFSRYLEQRTGPDQLKLRPLSAVINLGIWIVALVFLLDNLGFEISTIIAGLGIGGVAIALAAQALLGDLFSYFVIFMDKPFEEGDFLIFDDILGTVEQIGLKTTHLRSLSGEQIIVSNSQLTSSKVRNYKRMEERRVVFNIGVTYDTGLEALRDIPAIIREAVEQEELTRFDRSNFKEYGDSSLNFETVYYVLSPDYNVYMNVHERVNLAIYQAFGERGIQFAFPTRTIYMERGAS